MILLNNTSREHRLAFKMRTAFHLLLFASFLFLPFPSNSQGLSFRSLSTNEGLSHFSAMAIYQDEKDFIWIGTRNGINVYNGNQIKTYKQTDDDPNSIFCNSIKQITGDRKGHIYFQTMRGIARFDMRTECFTTMLQGDVSSMFFNERLYVARNNTIVVYNGDAFEEYYRFVDNDIVINCIYVDREGVLIGTDGNGLFLLNDKNELQRLISSQKISCIFKDRSDQYWIGSSDSGLFWIKDQEIVQFSHQPAEKNTISANFIRTICEDKLGNIWIGTFNGLNRYDKKSQAFTYYFDKKKVVNATWSSIWSLTCDSQGTIWAGTYFGGAIYFNPRYSFFNQYHSSDYDENYISYPIIGKIVEDNHNNLWICTDGGGLNRYDRKNKTFKWYKNSSNPNSLSHNNVKTVYVDSLNAALWIGTHLGGLNKFDIKSGRFTRYENIRSTNGGNIRLSIVSDIVAFNGQLILATDKGVLEFNPSTGAGKKMFDDIPHGQRIYSVLDLLVDSRGILWITGVSDGVYSYDFASNKLTQYSQNHALPNSLGTNQIHTIFEDRNNRLWFYSGEKGVYLYKPETDDFENYDAELNGISGNCVYGMCDASDGKLFVITDNNFSQFDYENNQFVNYNSEDGFPLSNFNLNSIYRSHNGEIFVGGINGLISFFEEDLSFHSSSYRIVRTRLIVDGEEIKVGDKTGTLTDMLADVDKITLKANQSIFSIEYSASNYISANKDELFYKLDGFSNHWTKTQGQSVTFTNLKPGHYTLIVKSSIKDDIPHDILQIEIRPLFYQTIWAMLFCIVIVSTILYTIVRFYKKKIMLQESLKDERKHVEDIENLNQQKLRFFTNISHEFRTPLTLIIGQVERLLQIKSFAPHVYNKILAIYRSSMLLYELITELLDFRKQEQGYMKIRVKKHNIVDFLAENYLLFKEYAVVKNIEFMFYKITDRIDVYFDSKQMQKVMNNLVSNAIKYTPANGSISISVRNTTSEAIIDIVDTGKGIAANDIDHIFDRFYQVENPDSPANTGIGIGLSLTKGIIELHHGIIEVNSKPGVGSTFTIRLKLDSAHFAAEEMDGTTEQEQKKIKDEEFVQLEAETNLDEENGITCEKKFKILIIEDDNSLQTMLMEIFEPFYNVVVASAGNEGLDKVNAENPDIILSDVLIPEISGIDLCKRIKNNIETCHIPVVLLTAKAAIENNIEGLRVGADDYITKPFNTNILISRCNNLINSRIVLQEKFSRQPQTDMQILATNHLDMAFMNRIMTIIEMNLQNEKFTVDELAQESGVARTKLFVKLKAITGQTPHEFITTIRLKKAIELLKNNPELNISEIADLLGFGSPRYFSANFKEKYGQTPTEFRKELNDSENK